MASSSPASSSAAAAEDAVAGRSGGDSPASGKSASPGHRLRRDDAETAEPAWLSEAEFLIHEPGSLSFLSPETNPKRPFRGRGGSGRGNARGSGASSSTGLPSPEDFSFDKTPSPSPFAVERLALGLTLGVSGSETVLIDPHNRDAVLRPGRGDPKPDISHPTCTAFTLDVSRISDGVSYSIPVRFSRFERLHADLAAELPQLQPRLPALPAKRGPLDPAKWSKLLASIPGIGGHSSPGGPIDDPQVVEERMRGLDAYVRALIELPGVGDSRALRKLVALSSPAAAAVRQARETAASHDEARATAIGELSRELAQSSAYVRAARSARERAETRASVLGRSLDSASTLLSRRGDAARLGRSLRLWQASCHAVHSRRQAKEVRSAAERARAQSERCKRFEEEGMRLQETLREAEAALERERQTAAHQAEALATLQQMMLRRDEAAASAATAAALEREAIAARAAAAAEDAAAARSELRASRHEVGSLTATVASLRDALAAADEELATAVEGVEARAAGAAAMRDELATHKQRRVCNALRHALEQRAAETRLLFLVQTQRESLERAALELAEVRRAAAVEKEKPELEAAWLKPPPAPTPPPADPGSQRSATDGSGDRHELLLLSPSRDEALDGWRQEWLTAMAHSL